ncbi:MAG: ABC transporter permease [Anaerolineales bacterium]
MSVPTARRNLLHRKGQMLLSVFGIAAALALILLLLGFRAGLYATLTAFVDNLGADLIVAQSGVQGMFSSNSALPMALHQQAARISGAQEAGHILMADIIFSWNETSTPVLLVGYDPHSVFGSPWKLGAGRNVQADDEIALDAWLAQRAGIALGDTISVLGRDFTVVGLTRETSSWMSPYIFITLDAAEQTLGLTGLVSYHLLRLPPETDLPAVAADLEAALPGVSVLTPEQIASADRRVLANVMDSPINVMLVIGVIIGVAVTGLTAYTAVTDRKREYGVLKAIGADTRSLAGLVIQETLYRVALGFLLGSGLAYASAALIMATWPQFNVLITPRDVLMAGALALGMSVLAALLPIQRINQIDPVLVFKD